MSRVCCARSPGGVWVLTCASGRPTPGDGVAGEVQPPSRAALTATASAAAPGRPAPRRLTLGTGWGDVEDHLELQQGGAGRHRGPVAVVGLGGPAARPEIGRAHV